ncbi:MAG: peptidoglycan-associated lipoprotein Pal [Pseudomonadota bacterium]
MNWKKTALALCVASSFAVGCSSSGKKGGGPADVTDVTGDASTQGYSGSGNLSGSETQGAGYGAGGLSGEGAYSDAMLNDPSSPLSKRIIYFIYDSSEVRSEFVPIVSAHASYVAARPGTRVVLDGHADERGSREYNVALGEQRANSVARMMRMQGVSDSQIEIVSYGEEKPASFSHDEMSWEQNRRVEINYQR